MELVQITRPKSLLDIGVGFGKFGFLCREYLELWDGRNVYDDWQHRIDGIEVFEKYITPVHKKIYDNIYIGDALSVLPGLDTTYDLVLLIDVIEHFTIEDGQRLLEICSSHSKACIVSTPHNASSQGDCFGNSYETHRSQWTWEHFDGFENKAFIQNPEALIAYLRFDGIRIPDAASAAVRNGTLAG